MEDQCSDNEHLVRPLFETFGRRQLDQAVALFADDVVFRGPAAT